MIKVIEMEVRMDLSEAALEEALIRIGHEGLEGNPFIEVRVCPEDVFTAARVIKGLSGAWAEPRFSSSSVSIIFLSLKNATIVPWFFIRDLRRSRPWEVRCGDVIVRSNGA